MTRVPLQTGASCLRWLRFAAVPAFVASVFAVLGSVDPRSRTVLLGASAAAFLIAALFGRRALRDRASDVLITREGLRIDGGPFAGTATRWGGVDDARVAEDASPAYTIKRGSQVEEICASRLFVMLGDGRRLAVAESIDEDETQSLASLADIITRASSGAKEPEPPARATDTDVLSCERCGAPLAPDDAFETCCHVCGATVRIPEAIRVQFALSAEATAATARIARRLPVLVRQPGAGRANALITATVALALGAFPYLAWSQSVSGAVVALAPFAIACAAAHRDCSLRVTLREVTLRFGARMGVREGDPPSCRRCGAPLPKARGAVVPCAYCRASNLPGVEVFGGSAVVGEDSDLEAILARRTTEAFLLGAIVVGVMTALVAVHVHDPGWRPWDPPSSKPLPAPARRDRQP